MELEQFPADFDWEDDAEATQLDDDFDAEIEFETEYTLGRDTLISLGFRRGMAF